jgi:hypothetical protein
MFTDRRDSLMKVFRRCNWWMLSGMSLSMLHLGRSGDRQAVLDRLYFCLHAAPEAGPSALPSSA